MFYPSADFYYSFFMKQLIYTITLSLILICVFHIPAFSQAGNGIISGQISDENGKGLAGATIVIEGTNIGTIACTRV